MKIFISHKNEDSQIALNVHTRFKALGVDAYLDVLDSNIADDGKALTEHIKKQLNNCTDIIVVMSEKTKLSWWVPFEIGMSAQIEMPTATYLSSTMILPDYLSYWPRLKSTSDVDKYVTVRKRDSVQKRIVHDGKYALSGKIDTSEFYRQLKIEL